VLQSPAATGALSAPLRELYLMSSVAMHDGMANSEKREWM